MVCRLERRAGKTPPQGLQDTHRRRHATNPQAARGRRKKSPGLGSAQEILQALAEAYPKRNHEALAARELARLVGNLRPHELTPLHVTTLVLNWKQRYSRNTTYGRRSALKRVLRHYEATTNQRGLTDAIPRVPGPRHREIVAQPDELAALHHRADPLERAWLRITLAFAMGQNEVRALAPAHYNAEKKTITFTRKKTAEVNTLPVPDDLAQLFEHAPPDPDPATPFLVRWNGGRALSEKGWRARWNRLKRHAAVRHELTPHDLRRTTASALYTLTHDLRVVQQLLGHQRLDSTVSYLEHLQPETLRPLLAQLWKPQTEVKQ